MVSTNHERYLSRIGLTPAHARDNDRETLERLQQRHVTTIPFETLAITGDPFGDRDGEGVSLAIPDLYEKIVERRRGGFCYELNGLFGWLLTELGFEVNRLSARIESDGELGPPADHLTLLVSLDRRYIVDVGLGFPKLRRPLALDGTVCVDGAGIEWRVVESDRPDADYAVHYRESHSDRWMRRCILRTTPRDLCYFEATCEHFQLAPESGFTNEPIVIGATDRGHTKLSPTTLTTSTDGERQQQSVSEEEWYDVLETEFGVCYPSDTP
jgi:N-hydroxyarylamine O-acetyltransferase